MKYMLVNVCSENDGRVSGNWIENHVGTIESAREKANKTEAANGHRITVAVVGEVCCTGHSYHIGLIRLS